MESKDRVRTDPGGSGAQESNVIVCPWCGMKNLAEATSCTSCASTLKVEPRADIDAYRRSRSSRVQKVRHHTPPNPRIVGWVVAVSIIAGTGIAFGLWAFLISTCDPNFVSTPCDPERWYQLTLITGSRASSVWCNNTAVYVCGSTEYPIHSIMMKWNAAGILQWKHQIDENGSYYASFYSIWGDNSFIYTNGYGGVTKWYPENGTQIWKCPISMSDSDRSICGDNDSIYVCGGVSLTRIDSISGEALWYGSYLGSLYHIDFTCVWTNGTHIYTAGLERITDNTYRNILVKWNSTGDPIWYQNWDEQARYYQLGSIWGDSLGNIYLATMKNDSTSFVLVKWDEDGNFLWNRTFTGSWGDGSGSPIWGNDDAIYTLGDLYVGAGINRQYMVLVKWDDTGAQQWNRTWELVSSKSIYGSGSSLYTFGNSNLIKWDAETGTTQDLVRINWILVILVCSSVIAVTIVSGFAGAKIIATYDSRKFPLKCPKCGYGCMTTWTECPSCHAKLRRP